MKTIHIDGCEAYRKKDGTWDTRRYSYDKSFTDEQVRHCDLCTMCGFPTYPECRDWCPNEKLAKAKIAN